MTTLNAEALDRLPVGSVVLARHRLYRDVAVWVKTDDTELMNEFGDGPEPTAWMSPTYTADNRAADLVEESTAIQLLWDGAAEMEES